MTSNKNLKHLQILGQCYKDLRISKGFSQDEAALDTISTAQLSNFEHGKSALSAPSFIDILQNINVTTFEIQNLYNSRLLENKDNLLFSSKITDAYMERNSLKLKAVLSEIKAVLIQFPSNKKFKLDKVKCEAILFMLNPEIQIPQKDINFVKQYLYGLKEWGQYDILLLGYCASIFDIMTLADLSSHMINPTNLNSELHYTKHAIIQTLNNLISFFTEKNQFSISQKFINYLEDKGIHEYYMYDKITLQYNKAMLAYKQGDKSALDKMKQYQEIIEACGCYNTAQMIEKELKSLKLID